jgi:hypothetical protein
LHARWIVEAFTARLLARASRGLGAAVGSGFAERV